MIDSTLILHAFRRIPLPDEHTSWPGDITAESYLRPDDRQLQKTARVRALADYLIDRAPEPAGRPDQNLWTHRSLRPGLRRGRTTDVQPIHEIDGMLPAAPGAPAAYRTRCGLVYPLYDAVRTNERVTCGRACSAARPRIHERAETVATPSGPCEGGAANHNYRGDGTGNTVVTRTGKDPLQLVQTAAANRGSEQPRSQVATAAATAGTTSLARAGHPSEGERRVLESVAPDVQGRPPSHRAER